MIRENWKRLSVLFLLLGLVLTACGGNAANNEPEPAEPAEESAPAEEPAEEMAEEPAEEMAEESAEEMDGLSGEIRFMYYEDGTEAEAMQKLVDQFMAENPAATVVLDVVPYSTIDEQVPILVETGDAPDMARLTGFVRFQGEYLDLRPYLQDPDYYDSNFNPIILDAFRAEGDDSGLYGFPDSFTVTGPYVNKTLFDQAGIPMPGPEATWEEWTEVTQQVAEATGTQYAISVDRTGHRIAGPAMSMGATLFDDADYFTIDTPGFRSFVELLNSWHEDSITPSEVWLVGDSINSCIDAFKSGDLVMCMSGSWQIGGMAADVGDAFDWVVVPNPSGPGGSTGVPGGPSVTAFASTEHPELVAAFMEFLIQPENYRAFSAETLLLPGHLEVASSPVPFQTDNESVLNALNSYTAEVPKLQNQGFTMTYHPFAFAYFRNSATRIGQYLTGELSLEEALGRLQQDIDDAVAEAMATEVAADEPAEEMADLTGEIRFMYYEDGTEAEAMQKLVDQFMAENPAATVVLDVVPYSTIDEQVPILVETGDAPDMARLTGFVRFQGEYLDLRPYLQDPDYYDSNFNPIILDAFRAEGDDSGLYGFPDSFTVTGPYVNKTLFDQAGIPMPGPEATWEEWTEVTQQVAEATGTQYAISVDRTGHRIAGPAMSMGATLFDDADYFTIDTPGFRSFVELLNSWHEDSITPSEVWLVGDSINSCIDAFKSGDLVMCMSGSWQIGGMAADVGDAFDWVVVPNPSGPGGSTGVPGGPSVTAFASTEHPELVAAFMEFLIQPENYRAFSAETLLLPGHLEVASSPVPFQTDNESVLNALNSYTAEVPKLQNQGFTMTYHPFAFAYFRNSATRIGQYLTGELSLEEALGRLQQDIDDAVAEAES